LRKTGIQFLKNVQNFSAEIAFLGRVRRSDVKLRQIASRDDSQKMVFVQKIFGRRQKLFESFDVFEIRTNFLDHLLQSKNEVFDVFFFDVSSTLLATPNVVVFVQNGS
jgi:hypothetical protein